MAAMLLRADRWLSLWPPTRHMCRMFLTPTIVLSIKYCAPRYTLTIVVVPLDPCISTVSIALHCTF